MIKVKDSFGDVAEIDKDLRNLRVRFVEIQNDNKCDMLYSPDRAKQLIKAIQETIDEIESNEEEQ